MFASICKKNWLLPCSPGVGFGSLPSFHPVCSAHRRKQWAGEVPERALAQSGSHLPAPQRPPATRSLATPRLMTAGCPVFPGSRFSMAECPLSLPPPSLFTVPPYSCLAALPSSLGPPSCPSASQVAAKWTSKSSLASFRLWGTGCHSGHAGEGGC